MNKPQLDLFEDVLEAYASQGVLSNEGLYERLRSKGVGSDREWEERVPVGKSQEKHSPLKRAARWHQQSLRGLQLLERVGRGTWGLTAKGRKKLTMAEPGQVMLGFSTDLGVALWANSASVFGSLQEPIQLIFTSLPYPLAKARDYGGPNVHEYVDWTCALLEPILKNLDPRGSVVLNVGNDIFMPNSPARSMYKERMLIALHDRLGLNLMDSMVWFNPARPPGPMQWASKTRQQLVASWEPVYWLAPNPKIVKSDNRRILLPHTEKHLALMKAGGETRQTSYGDGAFRVRPGSYGNETAGRIQRNVLQFTHNCVDKRDAAVLARAAGLPVHGATMPVALASLIISFLCEKGDLMVDPCSGWNSSGLAAERLGIRWMATEHALEYVAGAGLRFRGCQGYSDHLGLVAR